VDACERNVKNGLTNPHEIERFIKYRVRCYTVNDLHAKAYRADDVLFVGSMNSSTHSRDTLIEACLTVRSAPAVAAFESWREGLALVPLTKERIQELKKIYRAPKWSKSASSKPRKASAWIMWLKGEDQSDETEQYIEEISEGYCIDEESIFTISVVKSNNKIARAARPGDEFFVLDHTGRKAVHPPMRLIERPQLIGTRYRFALEYPDGDTVPFGSFLKAIRKVYAGFSASGKSQRAISPKAAAAVRSLWL
jgi:hypothetical protein